MYPEVAVIAAIPVLQTEAPASENEDSDATELADPRRLVEADDAPPNPEKPSLAARDSSGNRYPVLVIFDSHIRWYRLSFAAGGAVEESSSVPAGRLDAPTLAALAAVSCKLSP